MPQAQTGAGGDTLSPGAALERQISGKETHTYHIAADAGQYLRVTITHKAADLEVSLFAPDGAKLAAVTNPHGTTGPRAMEVKIAAAGTYRLEVRPLDREAAAGYYTVALDAVPVARDANTLAAEQALHDGVALLVKGNAESLRQAAAKFHEAFRLSQHPSDQAHALSMLAHVNSTLGYKQQAFEYYGRALEMRMAIGDIQGQMLSASGLASLYSDFGETQKALEHHQHALTCARELRNVRGQAITLGNLGLAYLELGDEQKALEHFQQALPLIRDSWDHNAIAATLTNLGLVYERLGDWQKALDTYKEALAVPASRLNRKQPLILHHLGHLYDTLGEKQQAAESLEQSLARARAAGDRFVEAMALNSLGRLHASSGETQKALEHCEQALALRREMGNRGGEAASLYELARIERDRGNLPAAQTLIESALDILESLRVKIDAQELRASYFASVQSYYEFYIDLLMRLEKANATGNYMAAALRASERRRARTLLETLTEARADIRAGADAGMLERERALRQQVNAATGHLMRLLSGSHAPEQAAEAKKIMEEARAQYQQIQAKIRAASPRYAALTQPAPLGLAEIRRQVLDADSLLLEYSLGKERSYLWAVTTTSISGHELPGRAEVEAAARRVYALLTARNRRIKFETVDERRARIAQADAEYSQAAAALSRMLLGPVAAQLKKRLLIVSDGALQYLPFAALPDPEAQEPATAAALALRHEIVTLPSASALAALRQEIGGRARASKSVAILADPVFDRDDDRLKTARLNR
ncbi:MAG TPA: tetratricopeptide repeat protein, partial [Blastocatellia bacterium]|nr:tetratricopeptide repeat protein [Blastocatellia bacterium]